MSSAKWRPCCLGLNVLSQYLKQNWDIVNCVIWNKLQGNWNEIKVIIIQWNAFENIINKIDGLDSCNSSPLAMELLQSC